MSQATRSAKAPVRLYLPRDSAALALGADEVADAIRAQAAKRGIEIELVRNGTRGMLWLEPLLEVETPAGRVAYGPVEVDDVAGLFDANATAGGDHPLALGLTEAIPYLKKQERLTFARVGVTDPVSVDDYVAHDGYKGLRNALAMDGAAMHRAAMAIQESERIRPSR